MQKLLIPLLLILLTACGQKQSGVATSIIADELKGQKIALKDFIVAKPAGVISSVSALELEFSQNMVLQNAVGQEMQGDFVEFKPSIKAKAKWVSTSLLQIMPDEPNEVLEIDGSFEPVSSKVSVVKLIFELRFADKADSAKLNKDLHVKLGSRTLPYKMSLGGDGKIAKIQSDDIPITDKAQNAEITLPAVWTANNREFTANFLLPAKGA